MKPLIIELIGSGGSGKSALIAELRNNQKIYAGKPRGNRRERLVPYIRALARTVRCTGQLPPSIFGYRRMFRRIVRVERGLRWCESLPPGTYVVDEGPLRTLSDMMWNTQGELKGWSKYAEEVIERIAELDVDLAVCRLSADARTRYARRRKRSETNEQKEKADLAGSGSYEEYKDAEKARGGPIFLADRVFDALHKRLPKGLFLIELDNSGDRKMADVAAEFSRKIQAKYEGERIRSVNPRNKPDKR